MVMAKEVKYVGLSLKDAKAALGATVKSGARDDGTRIGEKAQAALASVHSSLEQIDLGGATHYIVTFSEHTFIIIDHLPPPPPQFTIE